MLCERILKIFTWESIRLKVEYEWRHRSESRMMQCGLR